MADRTRTLRPSRTDLAVVTVLLLLVGGGSQLSAQAVQPRPNDWLRAAQTPEVYAPTAADASRAAAEQLRRLPDGAVQVDCAPGRRTLPIYTTLSGIGGPHRTYVLADGRCFQVPPELGSVPVEPIDP